MNIDETMVAIVTGGASGLGKATAAALRRQGARVALFDVNREMGEATARELGALFCQVDILSDDAVDAAFAQARAAHGQEKVLVNCAGIGKSGKTASRDKATGEIRRYPTDLFTRILSVNTIGTFRCISAAAAGMLSLEPGMDGARGVIINTGSVAAHEGQIGQVAYSASKGAIVSMTLTVARDLMNDGIRVNTILPGIFDTPLMMAVPDNVRASLAASVPFPKRFGNPDEFASLALEMIRNDYFNGEVVRLDGAIRMAPR